MPTAIYGGQAVQVNDDGFLIDPGAWNDDMVADIAKTVGVEHLDAEQMQVVEVMRSEYEARGEGPNVRALERIAGIPIKRLYELFPKGPAKSAAKIAGIPKPRGCI